MSKTYQEMSDAKRDDIAAIRERGQDFLRELRARGLQGREIALAQTKIEEAVMWAVKGVTG